jgi:signal transduction histidine kinase
MGTEFLNTRYGSDETTAAVLKEFAEAVQRADGVIKGLLDYSAPRSIELQPQDLNVLIKAVLRLVRGEIREGQHRVELELGEIPQTLVDRGKMMQVLLNLITNALQAMPSGGVLTVRTRFAQMTSFGANVGGEGSDVFRAGDPVVIVEVLDTGPGIPDGMLQRIFEPFVTTKATGKGTGLGLSVVRSIVNLHHGTIVLRNREEGGAAAVLTLKASDSP